MIVVSLIGPRGFVDQPSIDPRPAAGVVDLVTFEELFAREAAPMVRVAFLLLSSQSQAEEVVQDAFAQVYERWHRIDNPAGYLRTCVVNGARRQLRRRVMARDRERLEFAGTEGGPDHEYLADALAKLPAKRRAAVVLRYFADLSEADIADALGVRPGTVKSMLHRALADLRMVLS